MKNQTVEKANYIKNKIQSLLNHTKEVEETFEQKIKLSNVYEAKMLFQMKLSNGTNNWGSPLDLKEQFLPISANDFMTLYIMKCKAELKKLEKEFDDLRDE